ncbi:hypothetical protein [Antrihabitans sp. YC2-6]|uniref:hypothetical protein n=1 Tax=Antrihabitans sp. YC2-6 TaxID=2799498 RepID=UPI0018F7072E|nr:hypothetical protein [Antrihabitans sp. YC2-6]MBJ8348398.1 hypothetical protein [Antrihabitans sp. YC2-6]
MNFAFEVGHGRAHRIDFSHNLALEFVSILVDGVPRVFEYCNQWSRLGSYSFEAGRHVVQIDRDRGGWWLVTNSVFAKLKYRVYVDGEFVHEYTS